MVVLLAFLSVLFLLGCGSVRLGAVFFFLGAVLFFFLRWAAVAFVVLLVVFGGLLFCVAALACPLLRPVCPVGQERSAHALAPRFNFLRVFESRSGAFGRAALLGRSEQPGRTARNKAPERDSNTRKKLKRGAKAWAERS